MILTFLLLISTLVIGDKWNNPCQSALGGTATFMVDNDRNDSILCISSDCYSQNTFYTNPVIQGYGSTFSGYSMKLPLTLWYSAISDLLIMFTIHWWFIKMVIIFWTWGVKYCQANYSFDFGYLFYHIDHKDQLRQFDTIGAAFDDLFLAAQHIYRGYEITYVL